MTTKTEREQLEAALERIAQLEVGQKRMESFLQAHDALTRLVLDGCGLREITAHFGLLIQHSVEIEDRFHNLLAIHTLTDVADGPHLERAADNFNYSQYGKVLEPYFARVQASPHFEIVPPQPDVGITRRRLIAPVMVESELLGYVILLDRRGGFSQRVIQATEHAALIYALLMMKEKSEAETERRLRADFLEDLINPHLHLDEETLLRRGRYFGFNQAASYLFLMVALDNFSPAAQISDWPESETRSFMRQLYHEMSRVVVQLAPNSLLVSKNQSISVLTPMSKDSGEAAQSAALVATIQHSLARLWPGQPQLLTVSIAIGGVCQKLDDFPIAAQRARRCLEILQILGQRRQVVNYADLGLYTLLLDRQNTQLLLDFASNRLHLVAEYDAAHGAALLETLHQYFAHSTRLKETSAACHIHLSALKYRLRRIQEIGQFSLADPEVSFNLQLALKISQVEKVFKA